MGVSNSSNVSWNQKCEDFNSNNDKKFKLVKSFWRSVYGTLSSLQQQRLNYTKYVIYENLNIKSIKSKSIHFKELIRNKTDISLISETKTYDLLPNGQFFYNRWNLYRRNNNRNGGWKILYVKENIPSKLVNSLNFSKENKIIAFRFSISNTKWILLGLYKPSLLNKARIFD